MAARSKTVRYVKTNLCWITKKQNTHRRIENGFI